jgi:hypothetical protein
MGSFGFHLLLIPDSHAPPLTNALRLTMVICFIFKIICVHLCNLRLFFLLISLNQYKKLARGSRSEEILLIP